MRVGKSQLGESVLFKATVTWSGPTRESIEYNFTRSDSRFCNDGTLLLDESEQLLIPPLWAQTRIDATKYIHKAVARIGIIANREQRTALHRAWCLSSCSL